MANWSLVENQPLVKKIFKRPPIISYKRGKSLKDMLELNKKHWTREALSKIFAQIIIEQIILQAQNEPTPKWLETCLIRLKNKLKQAHRYAKSDSQISQSRLTDLPSQAQDYAKSGWKIRLKCRTNVPNQVQIRRPLRDPLERKIQLSFPLQSWTKASNTPTTRRSKIQARFVRGPHLASTTRNTEELPGESSSSMKRHKRSAVPLSDLGIQCASKAIRCENKHEKCLEPQTVRTSKPPKESTLTAPWLSVKTFTFLCFNCSTKESKNINSYQFAKNRNLTQIIDSDKTLATGQKSREMRRRLRRGIQLLKNHSMKKGMGPTAKTTEIMEPAIPADLRQRDDSFWIDEFGQSHFTSWKLASRESKT